MKYDVSEIVFPEGDRQPVNHALSVNQIVDINGFPVRLPLTGVRTIAYRVYRKSTSEERNEIITSYYLEQLNLGELEELT